MTPEQGGVAVAALLAAAMVLMLVPGARPRRRWKRAMDHPDSRPGAPRRPPGGGGARQGSRAGAGRRAPEDPAGGLGISDPALMLDLLGSMLDSGAGLGRALELLAAQAEPSLGRPLGPVVSSLAIGADWETAWRASGKIPARLLAIRDGLGFAALTGAPPAAILYAQAARLRREHFRAAERRAAALGVRLVLPLGLCSLPAFVCLGIVPVVLAMLPAGL